MSVNGYLQKFGDAAMSYDPKDAAHIHPHLHSLVPSEPALRVKALETLLAEKGLLTSEAVDAWVEVYQDEIGPKVGARVVARAWCDRDFKQRLLADGSAAIAELGIGGPQVEQLKVVENTDEVHNLVVCTLCSCYPFGVLGIQPAWYKVEGYRSRAVRDPRAVLKEFGVEVPDSVRIDVWDSTADLRYMVLPQRPAGSEGLDEESLAELVTRNSMIGTDRELNAPGR
jgi:nitrile hydratase